jgi:hypothetical protein
MNGARKAEIGYIENVFVLKFSVQGNVRRSHEGHKNHTKKELSKYSNHPISEPVE